MFVFDDEVVQTASTEQTGIAIREEKGLDFPISLALFVRRQEGAEVARIEKHREKVIA